MSKSSSSVTLHMVCSLDGFIAKKDDTTSWMETASPYERGVTLTEEEINAYLEGIDCYVMGARTYEHALQLGWPYGDTPVVVLTHQDLPKERRSVSFYTGDLTELFLHLRSQYTSIWLVGGALLAKSGLQEGLVDEIIVSIVPILLGDGRLFFDYIGKEIPLQLKNTQAYQNGMVELTYLVKKGY